MVGGFVAGGVVEHEVHAELLGNVGVDRFEEFQELDRAVALVQRADDLARLDVERGVEAGGAVALIVVGGALGRPGQHRTGRRGSIQRLNLAFLIDGQHDRAFGRVEIQAADVVDLLDQLRVGGEPPLLAAVRLQPERMPDPHRRVRRHPRPARAIDRVDQCVASAGVDFNVAITTCSTCSSVIVRGRLGRGSSTSPSSRRSAKRLRHLVTVGRETPSSSAISALVSWPAAASTSVRATPAPERSSGAKSTTPAPRRSSSDKVI
jgi:hypothetical protein